MLAVKMIKFLYFNGAKPIASLCKGLKVSVPKGVLLINQLLELGVLEKKGFGESNGGRRPELYGMAKESFYVLAISMDIYQTRMAFFNCSNEKMTETHVFEIELNNEMETLKSLLLNIEAYFQTTNIDRKDVLGVGLSVPGLVNSEKGINHTYLNFGEKGLRQLLHEQLQLPVFIENDANAIALAMRRSGVARDKENVLVLYLDWGIGLGLILEGKLYRGATGFAGEFSHIPIEEEGELCLCGKTGCLQTVAAGTALVKLAQKGILDGQHTMMTSLHNKNINKLSVKDVVDAALNGDQFAISLFSKVGERLGKGIAVLIQLVNPEMIVLGGQMARADQLLTTPIQQAVNTYTMSQIRERTIVAVSNSDSDTGLYGAMAVVMEDIFTLFVNTK
ncbi:putative sugar kinase [Geofilum rubicundum JCM 15548]|uniref:Putative sugar kinase n=1 Tax=Geofilum rubicundum JCM 15548 TaxID=1236989 RepID=A0A0E9LXH0_9BACT|nr:putative sugar kinase [Geofilum rubicundum JCM 15548]